jgi:hypothetical protein
LIFPNPATDQITIQHTTQPSGDAVLELYNTFGQLVFTTPMLSEKLILNTRGFEVGLYQVRLQSMDGRIWHKTISIVN